MSRAHALSLPVVPIPGASALITALCAAGLPSDRFVFEGFPPAKRQARLTEFTALAAEARTLIFYESPHRILESLDDMAACFGATRQAALCRELTKAFETIVQAPLADLQQWVRADENQQRGEFVVIVHGAPPVPQEALLQEALRVLDILLESVSVKQAAALAAKITGMKKNQLYELALERQTEKR